MQNSAGQCPAQNGETPPREVYWDVGRVHVRIGGVGSISPDRREARAVDIGVVQFQCHVTASTVENFHILNPARPHERERRSRDEP